MHVFFRLPVLLDTEDCPIHFLYVPLLVSLIFLVIRIKFDTRIVITFLFAMVLASKMKGVNEKF